MSQSQVFGSRLCIRFRNSLTFRCRRSMNGNRISTCAPIESGRSSISCEHLRPTICKCQHRSAIRSIRQTREPLTRKRRRERAELYQLSIFVIRCRERWMTRERWRIVWALALVAMRLEIASAEVRRASLQWQPLICIHIGDAHHSSRTSVVSSPYTGKGILFARRDKRVFADHF